MEIETEKYKVTLTKNEAISLCKVIGSLSGNKIKQL